MSEEETKKKRGQNGPELHNWGWGQIDPESKFEIKSRGVNMVRNKGVNIKQNEGVRLIRNLQ
jgi:hypothetical protein